MSQNKSPFHASAQKPLALLVDDHPATREILRLIFERAGWAVAEAGDARGALDGVRCLHPQLVTLDLVMPINEGFHSVDLVQTIDAEAPGTLLIIISAFSDQPPIKTFFNDREIPVLSKTNLDKPRLSRLLTEIRQDLESAIVRAEPESAGSN